MEKKRRLKTAIVVDDNPDVLSLFVELLELKDFKVIGTGRNGMDAVELFQKLKPDITFLDVVMPNADGLYALRQIREINPDSIVIMITTDLSEDTAKRLEDLKATAVVYKPFEINDLVKIVNDLESDENIGQIRFFN
ncbi:response regulator [Candidatus Nitrosotalea bavarica]|jgi:two-component system chemotaxis response regulator CheY/two-component system response regulator (stage 0 sporulation protein A)|uniref:response regulator n=1 Tax=Candidatus Nitrosotalea bavarica TaxID=1903277 RepID=UPI000C710D0C|nr:response regulator [Candidatus Nitrosotalea bavarica]